MTPVRVGTARDADPALAVWRASEQALNHVAKRLEVALLCVDPAAQRTGVARSLVDVLSARYPAVAAWSEQPELCAALGLVRTGEVRDEQVELVLRRAGA